jgi:tRNA pseudouridine65 synthase
MLEICYQDAYLAAVNKPHGLLVHRSSIARDATAFALQQLRSQLQQRVYPVHRLDRKTSGLLLFALTAEVNSLLQQQFMQQQVKKTYHAIVRGFVDESGTIDYPLKADDGKLQQAITHYKRLYTAELAVPFGNFSTSRYSLVEIRPETGRMHQIRKHFAHILHPIIGDRPHGCNKQNRLFIEKWKHYDMLLHAQQLEFFHPVSRERLVIWADYQPTFKAIMRVMGW